MKIKVMILFCAALLFFFSACDKAPEYCKQTGYAMDTAIAVTVYGDGAQAAADEAFSLLNKLDAALTRTQSGSDISALNQNQSLTTGSEAGAVLKAAQEMKIRTGGAYNATIAPVMDLWGFIGGNYRIPRQEEITAALVHVGDISVTQSGGQYQISLEQGMSVDLGGIAKGYASDLLCEKLTELGYPHSLVALGGNIAAPGPKPDGSAWRVGVRDPDKTANDYVGVVSLSAGSVVTSGDYERFFVREGKTYFHIIDPATGYPADSALRSVTVISPSGTAADALSTALFVMGLDQALDLWRVSDDFEAIFITDDHRVIATSGLKNIFTFSHTEGYSYAFTD